MSFGFPQTSSKEWEQLKEDYRKEMPTLPSYLCNSSLEIYQEEHVNNLKRELDKVYMNYYGNRTISNKSLQMEAQPVFPWLIRKGDRFRFQGMNEDLIVFKFHGIGEEQTVTFVSEHESNVPRRVDLVTAVNAKNGYTRMMKNGVQSARIDNRVETKDKLLIGHAMCDAKKDEEVRVAIGDTTQSNGFWVLHSELADQLVQQKPYDEDDYIKELIHENNRIADHLVKTPPPKGVDKDGWTWLIRNEQEECNVEGEEFDGDILYENLKLILGYNRAVKCR